MNIYLDFWKQQLITIGKKITPSIPTNFTIEKSGIANLGNRADYNGYATFWFRKNQKFTDKAVFRDLLKALKNDVSPQQFLKNVVGNLEIKIVNSDDIEVNYTPITFKSILDTYTEIQEDSNYLKGEIYKWELVEIFQNAWQKYEAKQISFTEFYKQITFKNLIFLTGVTIYNHVIKDAPDRFENLILYLFDETIDLQERIINYQIKFRELYFSLENHGENTFEEERTMATWLTFRYPNKYTFYKDEFYSKLCKGLGLKTQKPLYKLVHYYQLVNDFIVNFLSKETGIINKNKTSLNEECFKDENNLILAQDILYTTLIVYAKASESDLEEDLEELNNTTILNTENKIKMNYPLNQILYGPPGTGKTYNTIDKAIMVIENISKEEFYIKYNSRDSITKRFKELLITDLSKMNGQVLFTTFHQSMSYEDFIEGIKPNEPNSEDTYLSYEVKPGIFKLICESASKIEISNFDEAYNKLLEEISNTDEGVLELKTPKGKSFWVSINSKNNLNLITGLKKQQQGTLIKSAIEREAYGIKYFSGWEGYAWGIVNQLINKHNFKRIKSNKTNDKPYVLIIDEINRGNVSQIFGELITLIEDDKRIGKNEELRITLPYSKTEFGVPPNLYIIGTMNTADRSVEALDTALRRRFVFEEKGPLPELIATDSLLKNTNGVVENIDIVKLLSTINTRIEKLIDKDHQIGHAFFMAVTSKDDLIAVFENKILPLMQEYFYGDMGKIGLVLGNSFIEVVQNDVKFASFSNYDNDVMNDYQNKKIYTIKESGGWDFESIYNPNINE